MNKKVLKKPVFSAVSCVMCAALALPAVLSGIPALNASAATDENKTPVEH